MCSANKHFLVETRHQHTLRHTPSRARRYGRRPWTASGQPSATGVGSRGDLPSQPRRRGALAHAISDKARRHRRGDLFENRTVLMDDWAAFLESPEIVPLADKRSKHREGFGPHP